MKTVKDQIINGVELVMDDTLFVRCKISKCDLIFSGRPGGWDDSDITECLITLRGPAAYTAGFLQKFGFINPQARWDVVKLEYTDEPIQ